MSVQGKQTTRSQTPAVWVIALAVCGGGAIMVLGPIKQRLSDARAELESVQSVAARSGELLAGKPLIQRESARVDAEIEAIGGAGTGLSDPTALVSLVSDLAREAGVQVNRVSPKMQDPAKNSAGVLKPRAVVATTIQATGNYQAISAFLESIERQRMLGGVQSVRLTPMLSRGTVELNATIEMLHAAFSIPSDEELAAIALSLQGVEGASQ